MKNLAIKKYPDSGGTKPDGRQNFDHDVEKCRRSRSTQKINIDRDGDVIPNIFKAHTHSTKTKGSKKQQQT
jgi:hypothetical protein